MSAHATEERRVEVTNADKVLFPAAGVTKGRLVEYYRRVAGLLLPHLEDRPLVLHRFPDGIEGDGFIQKEASRHFPGWVRTAPLEKKGGTVRHVVCDDADTLVYLANQAMVTPHVWLSRVERPHHPDQLVFDLDPGDDPAAVPDAAAAVRKVLDELGLRAFAKSSGSSGLHIHVPLDATAGFGAVRAFARDVAELVARRHPGRFTTAARKERRGGRLFVDTLRNGYAQHAAAVYAVRPLPSAPIAVPVDWGEATSASFDPQRLTLENVFRRLSHKQDPWADFWDRPQSLGTAAQRLGGVASRA